VDNLERRDLIGLNTILTVVALITIGVLVGVIDKQATALDLMPGRGVNRLGFAAPKALCVCPNAATPGFNASDAANAILMTGAR
jgi:hypothetical protein